MRSQENLVDDRDPETSQNEIWSFWSFWKYPPSFKWDSRDISSNWMNFGPGGEKKQAFSITFLRLFDDLKQRRFESFKVMMQKSLKSQIAIEKSFKSHWFWSWNRRDTGSILGTAYLMKNWSDSFDSKLQSKSNSEISKTSLID